jgi:predicted metal-dependent HD superfamily phosphohydrolase
MSRQQVDENIFSFTDTTSEYLEFEWRALSEKLSLNSAISENVLADLLNRYSEKHRFYHNLSHISALLFLAKDFKGIFSDADSVKFAIWFHDAVYDPKRSDNETESTKFASESLLRLGLPEYKIQKIAGMILATRRHDAATLDYDGKLFLDLDLSILGADEKTYKDYSQSVRREYRHAPDVLYRRSRKAVLENFLRREFIYFTSEMRDRFETRARLNVENEVKELS